MDPLEVLELPMGFINYYYFQAWNRNQELEAERIKEEKRREEKEKKNPSGKIHPAQGGHSFSLPNNVLEDLRDELE